MLVCDIGNDVVHVSYMKKTKAWVRSRVIGIRVRQDEYDLLLALVRDEAEKHPLSRPSLSEIIKRTAIIEATSRGLATSA